MDIQHPDIDRIERTGYPDSEYIAWELQQQEEAEEEEEADELWLVEWQQKKTQLREQSSLVPSYLAWNEY